MPRKVLLMRKALTKEPELLLKPRGLGQRHPFVSPRREEKRVNMSDEVGTTTPGAPVADRDDDKAKETPSDNKQQPSSEHQPTSTARNKCAKCGRLARKGCTQSVCLNCCTDQECEVHKEAREQALWKEQVLAGTTAIQQQAAWKRSRLLPPRSQTKRVEPAFCYAGDTVVIWNFHEYMENQKWKEDALRKANKRKARDLGTVGTGRLGTSRKRFRRIMEELYQKSLVQP